ncbi:MAG: ABC-F family ATP-binding cassette domain-containing protein [Gammaproteobacteria bacterium]|nr:ABC-F family ATP-binding cassette domain-containing protein [Gammaproteobacteria bacterium]
MINCCDLAVEFGGRCLFKNVTLNLLPNHRYAIVGANGSGKSTLLKLLAGEEVPNHGTIECAKRLTVGMLRQDHFRYKTASVIEVVVAGNVPLAEALHTKEQILAQSDISEQQCYRLAELEETIATLDGYTATYRAEKILKGLGIPDSAHHGPLAALSGGYKLRVLLAQSLFQNPDILLLDEPTNHLDIVSIAWLESFLQTEYKGLLLFVSHDREFINGSATHVLDIDYGEITLYPGNYDDFLHKKEEILTQKEHELTHKKQQIASMRAYADRFRASPSRAKQAQARLKMIDRVELPTIITSSRRSPAFHFNPGRQSGKQVLTVTALSKSFTQQSLFQGVNFDLYRGQKCAIVGVNGIGKSTIIKILLDRLPSDHGKFHWSDTTSVGYFPQNFHDLLNPEQPLINWLCESANIDDISARKVLGKMFFSGDDINKKIAVLSGGECARLIFAKLIAEQHNVLVLDEPTNHLDLEAIEGLATGLAQFSGTILFVSHNRFFVQQLASSLIVMTRSHVECYPGTYQEFVAKVGNDYLADS